MVGDIRRIGARPFLLLALVPALVGQPAVAQGEPQRTLQAAVRVMEEFVRSADPNVSPAVIAEAEAVVIVPDFRRFGLLLFGAFHGFGVMFARASDNTWSHPVFIRVSGGTIGGQLGLERVDFVVAITSRDRVVSLMRGANFGVGAEATAGAAATAGSTIVSAPDIYLHARARGAMVGFGLRGATLEVDDEGNATFYGGKARIVDILKGRLRLPSGLVHRLHTLLRDYQRS